MLFRQILAATCVVVVLASSAIGQTREAIEDVIGNQLQAFNDRDVTEAFSYASPTIKGFFRDPDNFGTMVERGYPMVWDNAEVRFLDLRQEGTLQIQRVMIRDAAGTFHTLDYAMIETPNGWQINGVQLIAEDLSA